MFPYAESIAALEGLYLGLCLHKQAQAGQVLIYSNYIASLDGRIALRDAGTGEFSVPDAIANPRDWRLYQELAAQSDVMLTSARYFRQFDKGCAQDLLPVGQGERFDDIRAWRVHQGLKPQPDIVIVSASLDIPLTCLQVFSERTIRVITVEEADDGKRAALQRAGIQVLNAGKERVDGQLLQQHLINLKYRSAYMIAGPQLHHTLLQGKVLNRLFLTTHLSLLGHDAFHTILQGEMPAAASDLLSLYWDEEGKQLFGQYAFHTRSINQHQL